MQMSGQDAGMRGKLRDLTSAIQSGHPCSRRTRSMSGCGTAWTLREPAPQNDQHIPNHGSPCKPEFHVIEPLVDLMGHFSIRSMLNVETCSEQVFWLSELVVIRLDGQTGAQIAFQI